VKWKDERGRRRSRGTRRRRRNRTGCKRVALGEE